MASRSVLVSDRLMSPGACHRTARYRDPAHVGNPQWVAWTAGDAHDLDRCSELLKERGAYVGRNTSEGITLLEGRDPDGLPVIIVYPGAERAPRHVIHDRIRRA